MAAGESGHRMDEYGRTDDDSARSRSLRAPLTAVAAVVVLLVAAGAVASCSDRGMTFWRRGDNAAVNACPRPASLTGSEFNAQEAGLRHLRRAAFDHMTLDHMHQLTVFKQSNSRAGRRIRKEILPGF